LIDMYRGKRRFVYHRQPTPIDSDDGRSIGESASFQQASNDAAFSTQSASNAARQPPGHHAP
jgi:hypothetical protein